MRYVFAGTNGGIVHNQQSSIEEKGTHLLPKRCSRAASKSERERTTTVTRVTNKQIRTHYVRACDAVPWKSSAQRAAVEAERLETMRRQAEEEKRKSLSSQLLPSFATASQDVDKENAEGRRDVSGGKKCENVAKNYQPDGSEFNQARI